MESLTIQGKPGDVSTTERPHSVSVAGVIVDDRGRALLIQRRDNGQWEPPGGVLERGETIPEALQREVLEETGIKIALPATLTGIYKNMTGLIVSLVFRCEAVDGSPTTGEETYALSLGHPRRSHRPRRRGVRDPRPGRPRHCLPASRARARRRETRLALTRSP